MPPARREKKSTRAGAASPPVAHLINRHRVGRRWASLALRHIAGWKVDRINRHIKKLSNKSLLEWENLLEESGDVLFSKRATPGPSLDKDVVEVVQERLTSGGTGQAKYQSLRRAYPKLKSEGEVDVSRETVRRALHSHLWSCQQIRKRLPLGKCDASRVRHCKLHKSNAKRTAYSDSKYFEGETSSKGRARFAWAPDGKPLVVAVPANSAYKVHAYAAITAYGATPLYEVSGTKGPSGRGRGRPRGSRGRGRGAPAAPKAPTTVKHDEYRALLDDGEGGGMLERCESMFKNEGITQWLWQQDGATPHSVAATEIGRPTRALIEAKATLVEPWPAHSPDLSPIEKAWFACEQHMWATMTWHDLPTFKVALHASWAAIITPAYCKALFAGLSATYNTCIASNGAEVRGWGKTCKARMS